ARPRCQGGGGGERGFERPDRRARDLPARRDRGLAHGVARAPPRRRQAGGITRVPAQRKSDPLGNLELSPAPELAVTWRRPASSAYQSHQFRLAAWHLEQSSSSPSSPDSQR